VAQPIRSLLAQDDTDGTLVIVENGADAVGDLMPSNECIYYFRLEGKRPCAQNATSHASKPIEN